MLPIFLFVIAIALFIVAGAIAIPEPWHNRLVCFGLAAFAGAELAAKYSTLLH